METAARPLVALSLDLIARSQAPTGAYIAAPGYETYGYSWLRDGSFIAASMDAHGRTDSAAAFHRWVADAVERHAYKVEALVAEADTALRGTGAPLLPLDDRYTLHTRFTLEGEEGDKHWGDFQPDGYGFWLTSVARHLATTGSDPAPLTTAVDLVRRYLVLTWELPSFDCWEEHPTQRHATTWAAVAQGLRSTAGLGSSSAATDLVGRIERLLEMEAGSNAILPKFVGARERVAQEPRIAQQDTPGKAVAGHERVGQALSPDAVDGSALLILGDFGPFDPSSDIVSSTLQVIEDTLVVDGGVHRYLEDEFYGGGLWVVLGGALATMLAPRDAPRAHEILAWIEAQADASGSLPEQVSSHLRVPQSLAVWVDRWGPPARPLLWSHAMYLLAIASLDRSVRPQPVGARD